MRTPLGAPRHHLSAEVIAAMRFCLSRDGLAEDELVDRLYVDWYLRADPTDAGDMLAAARAEDVTAVTVFRAAHVDDGAFEEGWTVGAISNRGRIKVHRNGSERVVARGDLLPDDRVLLAPRPKAPVSVAVRQDVLDETGFWFTFLNGWPAEGRPAVARFYWAVRRAAAPALVRALTGGVPRDVPAAVKVGAAPHLLGRPDAAVLYVGTERGAALVPLLRNIAAGIAGGLRAARPPLTLALAPGLSAAEDPDDGQSFGQHRCRVLAAAARSVPRGAAPDDDALLGAARGALAAAGVDPLTPYRRAGSAFGDGW